jgi:hypothetical protein
MKTQKVFLVLYIILLLGSIVNIVVSWGDAMSLTGAWIGFSCAVLGIISMGVSIHHIKNN